MTIQLPISKKKPNVFEDFTLMKQGTPLTDIRLSVPGKHNIMNALAAAATADYFGISGNDIAKGLHDFYRCTQKI